MRVRTEVIEFTAVQKLIRNRNKKSIYFIFPGIRALSKNLLIPDIAYAYIQILTQG